jgi:hypothetical protein
VSSSHWLADPVWPWAVVLAALPLLAGPPSAVSGCWSPAVLGCLFPGLPAVVSPIPSAGQAGPLDAGPLPSSGGWVGLWAVLAGSLSFCWVWPGTVWSAVVRVELADAQAAGPR